MCDSRGAIAFQAAVWIWATRQLPATVFRVMNTMLWMAEAFQPSRPLAVVVTASWR